MCDSAILVPIPEWDVHGRSVAAHAGEDNLEFGRDEHGQSCYKMDACIVPALEAVWAAGFKTLGCCCGHGSGRGVISLDLGFSDRPAEERQEQHHCTVCGLLHQ